MPIFSKPSFPIRIPLIRALAGLAAAIVMCGAQAEPACSRSTPVDAECEIPLSALHPTQPAVGMMQVEERAARMPRDVDGVAYTRKHPIPVVQAPDGSFYMTDGHHLASVLSHVGVDRVSARLIGRLEDPASFWQQMRTRHWVYLFDEKGNPIAPSELPRRIADLRDDPYRSLATYAEDAGYFHKTDAYFMEFEWARYFGSRMHWQPINRLNLLAALQTAAKLACQPQASRLPGYAGPCGAR